MCGGSSTTGSVSAGTITSHDGTVTYSWKNSSGTVVGTTATVTGLSPGTYYLTAKDNCSTVTCQVTITAPAALVMNACSATNPSCNPGCGGSGTTGSVSAGTIVSSNGNVSYIWKNSSGGTVGTTATVSGLAPGTYTLTAKDNCSSVTCSVTITAPAALVMGSCSSTNATCGENNGSVKAGNITSSNGTVHYKWVNSSGTTVGTTATVSGLPAGTYTLTASDNCSSVTCSACVQSTGSLSCSITSEPAGGCGSTGGNPDVIYLGYGPQSTKLAVSVTGTGPFTYSWSQSNYLSSGSSSSPTFTPTEGGSYTFEVTVTSSSGCTSTCSITICVLDIRANGCMGQNYVYMCFNGCGGGQTVSVCVNDVPNYLSCGKYTLGSCNQNCDNQTVRNEDLGGSGTPGTSTIDGFDVMLYPNPFSEQLKMLVITQNDQPIDIHVYDMAGQIVDQALNAQTNYELMLGSQLANGVYLVEVKQGDMKKVFKVEKQQ